MAQNRKYYRTDRIRKENAQYNIVFGERSNGKTYAVEDDGLKDYCENGNQLGLIRRWYEDFSGKRGQQMFDALVKNGLVEKYTNGQWTDITYQSSRWYLSKWDEEKQKRVMKEEPFCFAFALSSGEHDKSTSYPKIKTILFDEFISRRAYIPNEFIEFQNILSTIIRDRDDVKIFMCGNTVNQFCPYFDEMGLTNILKMQKGSIDVYSYGDSGLRVAVEYCDTYVKGKKSDKYFAFNNPKLNMITKGDWELALYPHLPMEYTHKDIKFTYFIDFYNNKLQCEIIQNGNDIFTYIHRKTTPFKYVDKDLIYSQDYSSKPNWRRKITKPTDEIGKRIYKFFVEDKVFYQDNNIGEIVRNYLIWSNTDKGII